jgi:hypothetical protein
VLCVWWEKRFLQLPILHLYKKLLLESPDSHKSDSWAQQKTKGPSERINSLLLVEVCWVVMLCSVVVGYYHFRGSDFLHFQGKVGGMRENGKI